MGGQTAGGAAEFVIPNGRDSSGSDSMDSKIMNIQPNEIKISGKWVSENGKLVADAVARRIDYLIQNELVEIGCSDDGWSVLYLDNTDGRYWELNYPDSGLHGGGAPSLELLTPDDASEKYKISR